jgi:hypothetical protein
MTATSALSGHRCVAGELTSSPKVKRAVVARHYADLIDPIYGSTQ